MDDLVKNFEEKQITVHLMDLLFENKKATNDAPNYLVDRLRAKVECREKFASLFLLKLIF